MRSDSAVLLSISFVLCVAIGCNKAGDPPVETSEAAERLSEVLQAWKGMKSYESMIQRSPPIYFNEVLWREGNILLEFEVGEVTLHGRQGRCTVRLFLQGKDGKQFERKIGYQIDTTPNIVIVREGLGT